MYNYVFQKFWHEIEIVPWIVYYIFIYIVDCVKY